MHCVGQGETFETSHMSVWTMPMTIGMGNPINGFEQRVQWTDPRSLIQVVEAADNKTH